MRERGWTGVGALALVSMVGMILEPTTKRLDDKDSDTSHYMLFESCRAIWALRTSMVAKKQALLAKEKLGARVIIWFLGKWFGLCLKVLKKGKGKGLASVLEWYVRQIDNNKGEVICKWNTKFEEEER